jgi:tetratricopeptide (TPR) repeat protein
MGVLCERQSRQQIRGMHTSARTRRDAERNDRAMAYAYRGDAYATKANHDRAIQDCNEAIRLDPKYAYAYTVRGASYANKGNYDRAIQDYNEAIRLDPNYALVYTVRGDAYYNKHVYVDVLEFRCGVLDAFGNGHIHCDVVEPAP